MRLFFVRDASMQLLKYVKWPGLENHMIWIKIMAEAKLKREQRCLVQFQQHEVLVLLNQGQIMACEAVCPHQGFSLEAGFLDPEENTLTCPLHGWRFDLGSGQCQQNHSKLKRYAVKVEQGHIFLSEP